MAVLEYFKKLGFKIRFLIALVMGMLLSLAMAPFFLYPILYITFPIVGFLLAVTYTKRQAFLIGFSFGFGYFFAGLYWISHALIIFSDEFLWMVPFAAIGLPLFFGIYTGLAGFATFFMHSPLSKIATWSFAWVVMEWVRGHLFTGFPWNLLGQAFAVTDETLQVASLVGVYGLSALAAFSVLLFTLFWLMPKKAVKGLCLSISIFIPMVMYLYGMNRLSQIDTDSLYTEHGMRLVQSGIPQKEKWGRQYQARNLKLHLKLSEENRPNWVKTIIWPETAAAFLLDESQTALNAISNVLPDNGVLMTGAPRREFLLESDDSNRNYKLFSSMLAVDKQGKVINSYDKSHLVPFGEYVPMSNWLPIKKITSGAVDYSPGLGAKSLSINGLPLVGPLICYEIIFPSEVVDFDNRPKWLLNLTNDAWYGQTSGPFQHFEITRMRAIEQGIPVVRSANTGISTVFDPYGGTVEKIGLDQTGYIDFYLPKPTIEATLFHKYGSIIFWIIMSLWGGVLLMVFRKKKANN